MKAGSFQITAIVKQNCLKTLADAGLQVSNILILPIQSLQEGYYPMSQFSGTPVFIIDPVSDLFHAERVVLAGIGSMIWEYANERDPRLMDFLLDIADAESLNLADTPVQVFKMKFQEMFAGGGGKTTNFLRNMFLRLRSLCRHFLHLVYFFRDT